MSRLRRVAGLMACAWLVSLTLVVAADSQGRGGARRPPPPPPRAPHASVVLSGHVFIGGYFYDPFFGPYPWWPRTAYPYWYFPVYDTRAELRVSAETLERLPAGEVSEPPPVAPPVPPPPAGSYRTPRTPPWVPAPAPPPAQAAAPPHAVGFRTLEVRVQPVTAELTIDGQRWVSSDEGHFVVQVPVGMHRIEVTTSRYQRFATEIDVHDGETMPLNVSLMNTVRP